MLFSMSNHHWTETKMMFNAVDKSLRLKLHRKWHPKCVTHPNPLLGGQERGTLVNQWTLNYRVGLPAHQVWKKNQRNRWNMGRGFVLGLWIRASWWHKATPQLWRGREAGKFQKVIGWLTALDDSMRFRFLPVSMKRSRRRGREQGGRGMVKIMARDVQNFQSLKEKYVKKVDSRPEQSPCSRVLTARGLDPIRSKNGY